MSGTNEVNYGFFPEMAKFIIEVYESEYHELNDLKGIRDCLSYFNLDADEDDVFTKEDLIDVIDDWLRIVRDEKNYLYRDLKNLFELRIKAYQACSYLATLIETAKYYSYSGKKRVEHNARLRKYGPLFRINH